MTAPFRSPAGIRWRVQRKALKTCKESVAAAILSTRTCTHRTAPAMPGEPPLPFGFASVFCKKLTDAFEGRRSTAAARRVRMAFAAACPEAALITGWVRSFLPEGL